MKILLLVGLVVLGGVVFFLRGPSLHDALECAGLSSLPAGAHDVKVSGESAGFGRSYRVEFTAEPQALQDWLTRHSASKTPSCHTGQLQLKPDNPESIARSYVMSSGSRATLFVQLSL
jgi:hypothetical protein